MKTRALQRWLPLALLGIVAPGCRNDDSSSAESGDETAETGDTGDDTGDGDAAELPAPAPRAYRLTHEQWDNTVRDLFGLAGSTGLTDLLREDPQVAGFLFDNDATALEIDEALWTGYRIAAGAIAQTVTEDPELLAALMPAEGPSEAERIDAFVRSFGARAYRRSLTEQEVATLTAMFESAPAYYGQVADPFVAGIRHVIEATLQSPYFLYRIETSDGVVDDVIPLGDYEIASRLSYLLWNSMPDDELFAAALAGELSTAAEVAAQTERMLGDPRAADMVVHFHEMLLHVDKFETISPSSLFFPDAPPDLPELAAEEHERFVRDVVFGGGGGLAELLTASESFVNDDLAALYGVEGVTGDEFTHVELDPQQRRGVFTQIGFLAANSTSVDPDPIHRGVFMAKRMSCHVIAAPPDDLPPLPPLDPDQTNRERVAAHTAGNPCASCHTTMINPYGFVFESYDALGAWRTIDNGKPVDTAAAPFVGQESVPVSGAVELMDVMADSEAIHACYVRHWIEYAAGRNSAVADALVIARLGLDSLEQQQSIHDLLVAVTVSPMFLNRAAEELP